MKKSIKVTISILLAALWLSACSGAKTAVKDDAAEEKTAAAEEKKPGAKESSVSEKKEEVPDEMVAATVNGEKILKRDLEGLIRVYGGAGTAHLDDDAKKKMREDILGQLIDAAILFQISAGFRVEGFDEKVKEEYAAFVSRFETEEDFLKEIERNNITVDKIMKNIRESVMIKNYIDTEVIAKLDIPESELKEHYEKNKAAYDTPEQLGASHILIKLDANPNDEQKAAAMAQIKGAKERLENGEDFAAVAKEISACQSSANGGDLGYFGRGRMVKSFEDAAFDLEINEVSDIVTTQFGYHIIKVTAKTAAGQKSYEEVKNSIKQEIGTERLQAKVVEIIEAKKAESKIEIFTN